MTFQAGLRTAIQPWAEAALSGPLPGGFHRPLSRRAAATSVAFAHRCWMAEAFGRLPAVSHCFWLWPDCHSPNAEAEGGRGGALAVLFQRKESWIISPLLYQLS
ncbi:MAG: hypothetical protein MUC59_10605 [Saprospiraceae bacterium]|nr:hypothetical protein [Saprospiraceae bacterium]